MGYERIEFAKRAVIEKRDQTFASCEFAPLVLRLYPPFSSTEVGRFSAVLEVFQLRGWGLVFGGVGRGFGGYFDASRTRDFQSVSFLI